MRTPETFYNTDQIEIDAQRHGSHWFDVSSKRFFNSRVGYNVYPCANPYLTLFVSSERYTWSGNEPRLYSVRCYDSRTGNINTIGEFQEYRSSSAANNAAKRLAPTMEPSMDDLHEWGLALNENYDSRKRRNNAQERQYKHPYNRMIEYPVQEETE